MAPNKKGADLNAEKRRVESLKKKVEDATFGMKNKNKSKKVQQEIQAKMKSAGDSSAALIKAKKEQEAAARAREEKKQAKAALDALLTGVIVQPRLKIGQDPKSVLCEFFRHGKCKKTEETCKYSHDWSVERKGEEPVRKGAKAAVYEDGDDMDGDGSGMEGWDMETLQKAVADKHGSENKPNKTKIICKYFLDALDSRKYGWFWSCPNGKDCQYRHALPPGYVLKSEMAAMLAEEKANVVDASDVIEAERAKVDAKTKITAEVFAEWRAKKVQERADVLAEEKAKRIKQGRLTGREMFEQEGFEATDDAGAGGKETREIDYEEEERLLAEQAERNRLQAAAIGDVDETVIFARLGIDDAEADELFGDDEDD